jgi:hypothetical protein
VAGFPAVAFGTRLKMLSQGLLNRNKRLLAVEKQLQNERRGARGGAQISMVQVYSATRPSSHSDCSHLPLKTLSFIAQTVRNVAGLKAEVF